MAEINVAVPIDYGNNRACSYLSPATCVALRDAVRFLKNNSGQYAVAHCVANLPEKGMRPEESLRWKGEILENLTIPLRVVVRARTSIEEAKEIRDTLRQRSIAPRKIIIFCDVWHAMRLRVIWEHFFPASELEFRTDRYVVGSDYVQIFLRSPPAWRLANIAGLMAMRVFGIEALASIKQP